MVEGHQKTAQQPITAHENHLQIAPILLTLFSFSGRRLSPTMRLLRTDKLQLVEFLGGDLPPYAILSHTWAEEEVTFQDVQQGVAQTRQGHAKVAGACAVAIQDGFKYIV
jgi:hypothetical protein